jgi:hypothetical protein
MPHPDDDPDVPDLRVLGEEIGSAAIDFERERAIIRDRGGRLLAVETRTRLVKVVRRAGQLQAQIVPRVATRSRERRDSTRRSSSRGSPDGEGEDPEPARGRSQSQGERIKAARVALGLTQWRAAALTVGVVSQPHWCRLEGRPGVAERARPETRVAVALALKVEVGDVWGDK